MNIITSDVISAKNDTLWDDVAQLTSGLVPKTVLVLAADIAPGGPEDAQIQKMLAASKLNTDQYNVVMLTSSNMPGWYKLREDLQPKVVFLVGVHPAAMGISAIFRLNEPNRYNGIVWLPTVSVAELEHTPTLKSQLWSNGLKPIFVENKFGIM